MFDVNTLVCLLIYSPAVPVMIRSGDLSVDIGEVVLRVSPWVTEPRGIRCRCRGPGWMRLRAKLLEYCMHLQSSLQSPKIFSSVKSLSQSERLRDGMETKYSHSSVS